VLTQLGELRSESATLYAGGTDLLTLMKAGISTPELLIDIKSLDSLRTIQSDDAGNTQIGALSTLADIEHSPLIQQQLPILVRPFVMPRRLNSEIEQR